MPATTLTLGSLLDLDDGNVAAAVDDQLRRCSQHLKQRPDEEAARTVMLEIHMKPGPESVKTTFKVKTRLPAYETDEYQMLPAKDGTLWFQTLSPDNPRQADLSQASDEADANVNQARSA